MVNVQDSWYVRTSLITLFGGKIITVNKDPKYRPNTRYGVMLGGTINTFIRALCMGEDRKIAETIKFKHSL